MERVSQKPGGGDFAAICHCAGPVWIPDVWPANSGRRSQQQFESTYTTWSRVTAARGEILDRNGNVLVTNRLATIWCLTTT